MYKHDLAITVLEQQADRYKHTAFEGEYRYGDPKNEIEMWKRMEQRCRDAAEALKELG